MLHGNRRDDCGFLIPHSEYFWRQETTFRRRKWYVHLQARANQCKLDSVMAREKGRPKHWPS